MRMRFAGWILLGCLLVVLTEIPAQADGLLSLPVESGDVAGVQTLLAQGADVNAPDKDGNTPLFYAISSGHADMVNLLLAHGANVNLANMIGDTPLWESAANGRTDLVKLLLAHGANVNHADKGGLTPLMEASASFNANVVKLLLAAGADVNHADKLGNTPLSEAAGNGHADVVKLLLAQRADVNKANKIGLTPLWGAELNNHADVVKVLLAHGATTSKGITVHSRYKVLISHGRILKEIRSETLEAQKRQNPSVPPPVIAQTSTPPSASPTPHPSASPTQATSTAPSPDLSEIKQLIEAQNKEIQSLKARNETTSSNPSAPVYHSSVDRPSFHLPPSRSSYALVIGVERYPGSIPRSEYSDHDAQAVFQNMRALGIPLDHIKRLSDDTATRSRINGALHWLSRNVRPDSTVWVYFSGHGAPGRKGTAYLVPFDGDPTDLSDTGVRIETLYKKLNALKARHIIVALDSCFSGQGSRSVIGRVRPLVLKVREGAFPSSGKLIAFSAAKSAQEAGVLKDQGHGLFTYYFLKGLNKGAVHQGHVTIAGLYRYLDRRVTDKANLDNRSQTPMVQPELSRDGSVRLR